VIPLVSSVIGAGLNYYFVRAWGKRAGSHFRQRHLEMRSKMLAAAGHRVIEATPIAKLAGEASSS
jgi:hypothetical protein